VVIVENGGTNIGWLPGKRKERGAKTGKTEKVSNSKDQDTSYGDWKNYQKQQKEEV